MGNHKVIGFGILFGILTAQISSAANTTCTITPPGSTVPNHLCLPVEIPNKTIPFKIQAPCISPAQLATIEQIDLQACKDVNIGGTVVPGGVLRSQKRQIDTDSSTSSPKASGILDNLESAVRTQIECLYKGIVIDLNLPQAPGECRGLPSILPGSSHVTCSYADGEISENHLKESCGTFGRTGNGAWEQTQLRGLVVQAIKCYRDKVTKEVENQYQLTIDSPRCRSMANDYLALMTDARNLSTGIIQGSPTLSKEPTLVKRAINFCESDDVQL